MAKAPIRKADLNPDLDRFERRLRAEGFRFIAGADEAGRGALAGPLVAAAVILPDGFDLDGVADSKMLTARQRERACERILSGAVAVAVCKATVRRIDTRGLHKSNMFLLRRALNDLEPMPDFVLTDGWPVKGVPFPHLSIRKGDAVTASVAAASIVAKVTRDRMMDRYHRRFPQFRFDSNRGYGTRHHWDTLVRLGPTPIHRLSFKGVADPKPLPGRELPEELDPETLAALDEAPD
ncbi:MAG TPA: ribonuclease HII [Actinomycetota bacterium]|nr:ribonuclease HII [Actinomycetota bacterium]